MSHLEQQLNDSLCVREKDSRLRRLVIDDPDTIDFSSNDFLGLSRSAKMRNDYLNELNSMPQILGSTGSRILTANSKYVEDLEQYLATFYQAPSALIFNSGFDANYSLFSTIPQQGDIILYDECIHASVHDGMQHSRAGHLIPFAHSNISDLKRHIDMLKNTQQNIFVSVETVYSMDGDVAPLTEIVTLLRSYWPNGENGHLIVDEAHGTGVFGDHGRGVVQQLNLQDKIFARLHTFSKALASNGAVILGSETLRLYLINYARPFMFSTYMPFSGLALVKTAYKQLESEETVKAQKHLNDLIRHFRETISLPSVGKLIPSTSAIQGIILSGAAAIKTFEEYLNGRGFRVKAVGFPIVPKGEERIRICFHAHNTVADIDNFVESIHQFFRIYYFQPKV
ncbi:8-amino-7-oxononanoate synthase-like [Bradysia coprophila]|uniref:8-amino-7-oxononanoate synthase-like n=1 Tax=Bradysia coprophila TaxID=38358 RepID=UPI00187D8E48|nr:8-amino-7-oxononanoate synthase-like [Bradysia coprophila]